MYCEPVFGQSDLTMAAEEGGTVQGVLPFQALSVLGPDYPCPLTVTSGASWASAVIIEEIYPNYILRVTGDASNLVAGTYDTDVEVSYETQVGRCAHVTLIVTENASVPDVPRRFELRSWGGLKARYHSGR